MTAATDLWHATDRLTQPQPYLIERDTGHTERTTLPSLLDQLAAATDADVRGSGGRPQSRPPLDLGALSLLIHITATTEEFMHEYHLESQTRLGSDIRRVASRLVHLMDDDLIDWWTDQFRGWANQISATISNDLDRSWRMHGVPCPSCGRKMLEERQPDRITVLVPAMRVVWFNRLVRAVECAACGLVIPRSQLAERITA